MRNGSFQPTIRSITYSTSAAITSLLPSTELPGAKDSRSGPNSAAWAGNKILGAHCQTPHPANPNPDKLTVPFNGPEQSFGPDKTSRGQFVLPSSGEGRTVGTLDRAAGILIRRLVQRPRLYEVGGVEASGKQPQTGASRSRACFAPALLAQDRCQLEPGRPLLPSVPCSRPSAPSGGLRSVRGIGQATGAAARIQLDDFWFGSV